jgi:hypothetical protein
MELPMTPEIQELQEHYDFCKRELTMTPEFISKEAAGAALNAAITRVKAERKAAREAAYVKAPVTPATPSTEIPSGEYTIDGLDALKSTPTEDQGSGSATDDEERSQ